MGKRIMILGGMAFEKDDKGSMVSSPDVFTKKGFVFDPQT